MAVCSVALHQMSMLTDLLTVVFSGCVFCCPPPDAPGAPSTPECSGTTEDSITLKWEAPRKDGGSPIKGYVVEKREKGDKKWAKCVPATSAVCVCVRARARARACGIVCVRARVCVCARACVCVLCQ